MIGQRSLAFLGPALAPAGAAGWFDVVDQTQTDVRSALRTLSAPAAPGTVTIALLSYEACVSLDARLPTRPHDPSLGPDVVVTRARPMEFFQRRSDPRVRLQITPHADAHARHLARVRAARERLLDGVIYQANLAHRLDVAPVDREDATAFFAARGTQACAAWLDIDGFGSLVSLSPERFVTIDVDRVARSFPIKGTRPRGKTPDEDRALLDALLASTKDAAEHVMIVDLLRNDLGRVAVAGGVTVEQLMTALTVANVHHLESTIAARLRDDVTNGDVLAACAPGGSITGAPKSSAVETIYELEDGARGPYTGTLIVVDDRGALRSSLLIRTWLRPEAGVGALHVGGGIVVDSDPEDEWQETLAKARAFA